MQRAAAESQPGLSRGVAPRCVGCGGAAYRLHLRPARRVKMGHSGRCRLPLEPASTNHSSPPDKYPNPFLTPLRAHFMGLEAPLPPSLLSAGGVPSCRLPPHNRTRASPSQPCPPTPPAAMPIIYGFVARGQTVLAEYTSHTGNFATVAAEVRPRKCPHLKTTEMPTPRRTHRPAPPCHAPRPPHTVFASGSVPALDAAARRRARRWRGVLRRLKNLEVVSARHVIVCLPVRGPLRLLFATSSFSAVVSALLSSRPLPHAPRPPDSRFFRSRSIRSPRARTHSPRARLATPHTTELTTRQSTKFNYLGTRTPLRACHSYQRTHVSTELLILTTLPPHTELPIHTTLPPHTEMPIHTTLPTPLNCPYTPRSRRRRCQR